MNANESVTEFEPRIKLTPKPCDGLEGDKRQYLPYVLEWECRGCRAACTEDFTDSYLMYPDLTGNPIEHNLWCKECQAQETITLRVKIVMEIA